MPVRCTGFRLVCLNNKHTTLGTAHNNKIKELTDFGPLAVSGVVAMPSPLRTKNSQGKDGVFTDQAMVATDDEGSLTVFRTTLNITALVTINNNKY